MISRAEIFREAREGYRRLEPILQSAARMELEKISVILNLEAVKYLRYEARLKPFESIRDNFERYSTPSADLVTLGEFLASSTDLIGLRFVTLYNYEVDLVDEALSRVLEHATPQRVFSVRDRMKGSEFGYRATHWKYPLVDNVIRQAVDDCEINVEVQVRSTLSDAWAVHSRKLVYKSDAFAPEAVLREFAIASAILESLDAKMDDIAAMIGQSEDRAISTVLDEFETKAALEAAIHGQLPEGAIRGVLVDLFGNGDVPSDKVHLLVEDAIKGWARYGHIPFSQYGIDDGVVKLRILLFGADRDRYSPLVPLHYRKRYIDLLAIGASGCA